MSINCKSLETVTHTHTHTQANINEQIKCKSGDRRVLYLFCSI